MDVQQMKALHARLVQMVARSEHLEIPKWRFDGLEVTTAEEVASMLGIPVAEAKVRMAREDFPASRPPGWEGSQGPFPSQYNEPHSYARDVHSGAGNCVCGRDEMNDMHVKDIYGSASPHAVTRGVGTVLASRKKKPPTLVQRANALAYRRRRKRKKET